MSVIKFFGLIKRRIDENKVLRILAFIFIGGFVSIILYLFLYHRYPIYFTHVNWIYRSGGDAFQHQIGWEFFRKESWHFPIGKIASLGYPYGTNLVFLDSIPLLAIPFKIISPYLESRFQYLGLWEFISLFLQFSIGVLILKEFTKSWVNLLLGGLLIALSPPMIYRAFGHSSLTAHWLNFVWDLDLYKAI